MAEFFGAATGVLQVAEVGFSLATTLYNYASTVKGAEKDLKAIAKDVELTSKVLQQTHEQIKKDQDAKLCTTEAIDVTGDVLQGCHDAFQEVDDALKGSIKSSADGKFSMTMAGRLKWPLKSNKLEVLRANLEKLKTTLLLMLSVLAYGRKLSSGQTNAVGEAKVQFSLEKLQIQNLVQARDEATQRYEELSAAFLKLESRLSSHTAAPPPAYHSTALFSPPSNATFQQQSGSRGVPANQTSDVTVEDRRVDGSVATHLSLCASAVTKLAATIDLATHRWHALQVLEHNPISNSLTETAEAIKYLNKLNENGTQVAAPTAPGSEDVTTAGGQEAGLSTLSHLNAPSAEITNSSNPWDEERRRQLFSAIRAPLPTPTGDGTIPHTESSRARPSTIAGSSGGGPKKIRKKFEFETDSSDEPDEDTENKIVSGARLLALVSRGADIDLSNRQVAGIAAKTDKVDEQIAHNRKRLSRIDKDSRGEESLKKAQDILADPRGSKIPRIEARKAARAKYEFESDSGDKEVEPEDEKQEIRFINATCHGYTPSSARRVAAQAEQTGQDTLARLGAQGEGVHSTNLNSEAPPLADARAAELKKLNRSMFPVHTTNPFTGKKENGEDVAGNTNAASEVYRAEREDGDVEVAANTPRREQDETAKMEEEPLTFWVDLQEGDSDERFYVEPQPVESADTGPRRDSGDDVVDELVRRWTTVVV